MAKNSCCYLMSALLLCGATEFCGNQSDTMTMEQPPPPPPEGDHPPDSACPTGPICITELSDQTLKLGQTGYITGKITTSSTYGGNIKLTVNRADLDTATNATDMPITLAPDIITLGAGQSDVFLVAVRANTTVADVKGKSFFIHAQDMAMANMAADSAPVLVTTTAVLEIEMFQTGKTGDLHIWKIDGIILPLGNSAPPVTFRARASSGGVMVKLINRDSTASHIFHCNGTLIMHQPTTGPGTAPNKSYDNVVAKVGTDGCYDHNLDNSTRSVQLKSQ